MDAQKLAIPLLAFAGGAILGRVLGLKTLVRGAMTAAAVTGMATQPARITTNSQHRSAGPRRHKAVSRGAGSRGAPRKSAAKRSAPKKSASA
jgi:hypothetical protein